MPVCLLCGGETVVVRPPAIKARGGEGKQEENLRGGKVFHHHVGHTLHHHMGHTQSQGRETVA